MTVRVTYTSKKIFFTTVPKYSSDEFCLKTKFVQLQVKKIIILLSVTHHPLSLSPFSK